MGGRKWAILGRYGTFLMKKVTDDILVAFM